VAIALLVGQIWIARSVARIWPEVVVFRLWSVWTAIAAVLTPISKLGRGVDIVLHRLAGKTPALPDEESLSEEIRSIVSEGERSGALEEDAKEMIERIITLGEVLAAEIMRPRTEMICMAESLSWDEMLEFVVHCGHSRIPVYRTNRDDIVGILYAKDLLPEIAKRRRGDPATPWPKLLRKPMFVPETKPVDALLEDFQRTHNHMAIVLDEYGGVAGLVTLEDIIEEIVGEIVDEFDTDEVAGIQRLNGNSAEVLGNVRVDELNREFRIDLPEGPDFDTVAGLIMSRLGHVPVPKESIELDGVRLTVLDATPRRVNKVLVEVLDE
ncbi:MAG: HlyC/CorC family transporter, partial [Planctomycetota bacterium]